MSDLDLNSLNAAAQVRDIIASMVAVEIKKIAPRWGQVYDINQAERTAQVLFPNDTTPAVVKFSPINAPTRGLNTDPSIDYDPANPDSNVVATAAGSFGDIVKVEGTVGNLWITDSVSTARSWTTTFTQSVAPTTERTTTGPVVPPNPQEGDEWINESDGNKRFVYIGGAWVPKQDQGIADAQNTANNKNKTFTQATAPTATAINDEWIHTGDGNKRYVWDGVSWVPKQDQGITDAKNIANSKNKIFTQGTAPVATAIGDEWINSSDKNKRYIWDGSSWVIRQDQTINDAQNTANSKTGNFVQATAPTATGPNDTWINTSQNNAIYTWNSTTNTWQLKQLGTNALASLDASVITAGTLYLTNGSTSVAVNANGVVVATGAITLEMNTVEFKVVTSSTTVRTNSSGFAVVTSSSSVAVDATGLSVAAGTYTVTASTNGMRVVDSANALGGGSSEIQGGYIQVRNPAYNKFFNLDYTKLNWLNNVNGDEGTLDAQNMSLAFNGIYVPLHARGNTTFTASGVSFVAKDIVFTTAFVARTGHQAPSVYVNIPRAPDASGGIPRKWVARTYNVSITGFSLIIYSMDSTTASFSAQTVEWTAIGGRTS